MADLVTQRLIDALAEPPELAPPPEPASANSLQRREGYLHARETAMMTQMRDMMMSVMNTNNHNNNYNPHHRGGRNTNGRGRGGRTPGRGNNNRPAQPRSYCWTHGACAHTSSDCNRQSEGHQNAATFANMLNGSTAGCFWLPT
jgi:hypothetical protein